MELRKNLDSAIKSYVHEFCKRSDTYLESWDSYKITGVFEIADLFLTLEHITFCVDNDVSFDTLYSWYYAETKINLKSWVMGLR